MHEIAERAGVGKATVSLALRDDPRLRPETRRRIQRLAAKMGYRTNATVANLMAQLRASRTPKYQATLGLLDLSSGPASPAWLAGCEERAGQLGYKLEPFQIGEAGQAAASLASELEARNIRGLVVAGGPAMDSRLDPLWRRFSCVAIGPCPADSTLNFATNDHFSTSLRAVRTLRARGYRRMSLVISPELDTRLDLRISAGFWAGHEGLAGCDPLPTFPFEPSSAASFRIWLERFRPDLILTLHAEIQDWLNEMGIDIPGQLGLAHLDAGPLLPGWSGMDQNHALIGAAAIEMLIGQLHRNETGIPDSPKASFIRSTWIDGATTVCDEPAKDAPTAPDSRADSANPIPAPHQVS
jgi:LacI family transcriptional regulator